MEYTEEQNEPGGRFYTADQIYGALNYGYMLAVWKYESIERFDDKKIRRLMDEYVSDLDDVNTQNDN